MELSDAYKPPNNKPLPPRKDPKSNTLTRSIITCVLGVIVIGILVGMLLPATRRVRPAARRVTCMNNMRQIVLAMHNYESKHGHFPPAFIADENGKPMHSWRVLILPFMERQNLYERYSMDEPWNGPNNRLLADEINGAYQCPSHDTHDGEENGSQYCLVTGEGTLFEGDRAPNFSDIRDGTSNTAILVEVNRGNIHWMEPKDLTIDEAIGVFTQVADGETKSNHHGIQVVALADGSTQSLSTAMTSDELRKLFLVADEFPDQE